MKTKKPLRVAAFPFFILVASLLSPLSALALTAGEITNGLTCSCSCNLLVGACASTMECSAAKNITDEVTQLIDQGKSQDAIMQVMTRKYGERILAAPTKKGFNLTAWIMPFVALLLGGAIVYFFLGYCLKARKKEADLGHGAAISPGEGEAKYFAQLEKELKDFEL